MFIIHDNLKLLHIIMNFTIRNDMFDFFHRMLLSILL